MNEEEYIKAYNYGYVFKQHKPLLFDTVSKGLVEDTNFRQGFRDGGVQYEKDYTQQQIKDRMVDGKTKEQRR